MSIQVRFFSSEKCPAYLEAGCFSFGIPVRKVAGFTYIIQFSPGTTLEGGGAEGALAPPEFEGSERRTEGETDNPLLIAPSESKF